MIPLDKLEDRINEVLKDFKQQTSAIACSVLDKDGFIISSEKDDSLDDKTYKKKLVNLFTTLESLKIINFYKKTEYISFQVNEEENEGENKGLYSSGFKILIRSIDENIIFLSIFDNTIDIEENLPKFNETVNKLSAYFLVAMKSSK